MRAVVLILAASIASHSLLADRLADLEILSIDFISKMAQPAPFLIAITAEQ
jgi:hypothetical protein